MSDLYNNEAEQRYLAGILKQPERVWDGDHPKPSDFVNTDHVKIMSAILQCVDDKEDPVPTAVNEKMASSGNSSSVGYMLGLLAVPVSNGELNLNGNIIKSLAVARRLGMFGAKIITLAQEKRTDYGSVLEEAERGFRKLMTEVPDDVESPRITDVIARFRERKPTDHIPISFSNTLQTFTGGFQKEHFWVIGGFSSTGKSAFATNIALDALASHKHIAIISAEMSEEQYLIRMLSTLSGVPQLDISNNITIGLDNIKHLQAAERLLAGSNLYIYDNLYTMPKIRQALTRLKTKEGLDMFILDYIQNISVTGDEVSDAREVALECQRLAKDLSCTVVAMSQLSNAQAKYELEGGDENYYSLKGHGAIRDAADVILTLHRDRAAQSSALKVKFRKNRHGALSDFMCRFDLPTGRIEEIDWEEDS